MLNYFRPVIDQKINHDNLKKIVELIGERYSAGYSLKKITYFKIGLIKIKREAKYLNNVTISFSQIRSFLNPTQKSFIDTFLDNEKYYAKIPYTSHIIYKTILSIVKTDDVLLFECRQMNLSTSKCVCKDSLIKDFYNILIDKSGFIKRSTKKTKNKGLRDLSDGFQKLIMVKCL
jgi:hypothetical protein